VYKEEARCNGSAFDESTVADGEPRWQQHGEISGVVGRCRKDETHALRLGKSFREGSVVHNRRQFSGMTVQATL